MKLKTALADATGSASLRRDVAWCGLLLAVLLAWDASGFDLPLVRWFGTAQGFPWRDRFLTSGVLHEGGRALGWGVFVALLVNLRWPLPFARALSRRERWWWLGTTLLCVLLIPVFKRFSLTSCPWSLIEFGGNASHVSHWALGQADGGDGRCFPSGHASGAFCFLSGWWVLRGPAPRAARWWLALTVGVGLAFGWGQMMRGAHYASHTLWTAWICWAATLVSWHVWRPWR
jgi:membrane-associated PAP2 superfamily phosphatase